MLSEKILGQMLVYIALVIGLSLATHPHDSTKSIPVQNLRLIELNETNRIWISSEKVTELINDGVQFMDVTDFPLRENKTFVKFDVPTHPAFQDVVQPLISGLSSEQLQEFLKILTAFPTRYYNSEQGENAVLYLAEEYQKYSSHRNDVSINLFSHSWRQKSIITRIAGEGPTADEVVIIGAHVDSVPSSGIAPGADDDGSGTTTVLEVFRALSLGNFKPKRTIEFHGYSAEEQGLLGSQAIVQDYESRGIKVVGMMQLDMTGYVGGSQEVIGMITDYNDPELTQFTRTLVEEYTKLPWADTRCGYACSDNASWNRRGFRSCYPNEGLVQDDNPYIHSRNDVQSHLNADHMLEIAKLGLSFLVEMSLAP